MMKLIKSVLPLLTLFSLDTGQETAVSTRSATRPALPMWQPVNGDGRQVKSITRRVIRDGNVTIHEEEVVFINEPQPVPPEPYMIATVRQNHPLTTEQQQMLADWQAGRAVWVGGTRHPADILRHGSAAPGAVRMANGRIIIQERVGP